MSGDILSRVASGWIRACMAVTAALDVLVLFSVSLFGGGPVELFGFIVIMVVFGLPLTMVLTCLLSGIPSAIVIWLGEWLAIRSVLFYAGAGAAIGTLIGAVIFPMTLPPLVIFAAAGCLGGVVYWFAAGWSAGNQHGDDPTDAPLRRLCSGTSPRSCAVRRVLWGR
ncbi:hypothetical protein JQ581_19960 [Bradyrhizobium liaoningense]|uniref:hypothetical protein n=1 Tax=Bradyrhizobium liaoningense TaxID=43992 RepID=UPI001BAD6B73|nr:hypothetical protein [Bradyrhizobium liaoningense]MBR0739214.1 hypothetical protein [Bradyrhizobium liaoningense]